MTASLFVTGTPVSTLRRGARRVVDPGPVAHAVAKPAVDGLESSVCGELVTAAAARDWRSDPDEPRCEECARIAG